MFSCNTPQHTPTQPDFLYTTHRTLNKAFVKTRVAFNWLLYKCKNVVCKVITKSIGELVYFKV
jgi:hypothetical protein